jgi:hypothetical protein
LAVAQHELWDRTVASQGLVAEVLPDVPAVADLQRAGQSPADRLAVGPRAVAADDLDAGMLAQPSLGCVSAAVGQYVDPFAGLDVDVDVDEDGGVAVAPLQSEVVDAEHSWHAQRRQGQPRQHPQCGRARDRDSKASRQAGARPAR